MTAKERAFVKKVWAYYDAHGRHDLPWRQTTDPYRILISEIMLQQTQVDRVLVKYREFLKCFPTIHILAKAPLADVLRAWQGLGYNRRARMLKLLAEVVVRDHKGKIPSDLGSLLALPGVGQSTAGAVRAFAFNMPTGFIETNIRRAYIHFFYPEHGAVHDRELREIINRTVDPANPREWYWALMDYGSQLPKTTANPNRRSAHYTKQSKFEGSLRQARGVILRMLATRSSATIDDFKQGRNGTLIARALVALETEGFIKKHGRAYTLA